MSKQIKKNIVAYIRISPYYKEFLVSRYGNLTPKKEIPTISFPVMSRYADVLSNYLIENSQAKLVSNNCYSYTAFNSRFLVSSCNRKVDGLTKEEKKEFLAVVLPERINKGCIVYEINLCWQLSSCGVTEFNKVVKREFWMECNSFIEDSFHLARIEKRKMTRENAIGDFMMRYKIPMSWYENMLRYEKRFRGISHHQIKEYMTDVEDMVVGEGFRLSE